MSWSESLAELYCSGCGHFAGWQVWIERQGEIWRSGVVQVWGFFFWP
jgi:hypothetical protein